MRDGKRDVDFASTVTVSEILPAVPQAIFLRNLLRSEASARQQLKRAAGLPAAAVRGRFHRHPGRPRAPGRHGSGVGRPHRGRGGTLRHRPQPLHHRPGLYAVGAASADSPVLVTANYKLTFDTLRRELAGVDAWVLVLDTRGVNVWCAAGKNLFSHDELALRVQRTGLERVVRHRRLILPQLAATGVSARQVKKKCGFEVVWGPVRARDIHDFLRNGMKAEQAMRRVTFTFGERLVLVPVELSFLPSPRPSSWRRSS